MNVPAKIREIYLNSETCIEVSDQVFFQTGDDGIHQWESGIVLARYVLSINPSGSILELGSGSGLVGITAAKFTSASSVTLSDYNAKVLENIQSNLRRNNAHAQVTFLDWTNPATYTAKADLIVGSDLIYDGAPIEMLINTILHHLEENGTACILMPDKRKMTPIFLAAAEAHGLSIETSELTDWFTSSPHIDAVQGLKDFAELTMRKYMLYSLKKT